MVAVENTHVFHRYHGTTTTIPLDLIYLEPFGTLEKWAIDQRRIGEFKDDPKGVTHTSPKTGLSSIKKPCKGVTRYDEKNE